MKDISSQMSSIYEDPKLYSVAKASSYNIGRTFTNSSTDSSIRSEFTRDDYNNYRPTDAIPRRPEDRIHLCMKAYENVGIVRNVIDLMADFTCKGVSIVHPNPAQEKFFKEWWSYIDGDIISERFANYLYRIANVPVTVSYGKVPVRIERKWSSAYGQKDLDIKELKTESRRIPLKYSFINPLTLEVIAPELALFTGKTIFGLRISSSLRSSIASLRNKYPDLEYNDILQMIPSAILSAIKSGKSIIPINDDTISMYYYKKDDWDVWAKPMIGSILDDLVMLEKTKLADMAALDGAISNVRLWSVGKMEGDNPSSWVIPTVTMINKVRNIIANHNVGGGTMDLVWGPDLKFTESNTNVHNFLGSAKYDATLANIYEGLVVPFGTSGGGGKGMTNSFIAMQTFIERLEYGRRVLSNFWNCEIKKVQLAMGYSKPAELIFDKINLGDDNNYKTILLGLLDRDVISNEAILKEFGYTDIEKTRVKRETKSRGTKMPAKAGPFHNPELDHDMDMKKILLQRGGVAPSEVGLGLSTKKDGEKSANEQMEQAQLKLAEISAKQKAQTANTAKKVGKAGRPTQSKDTSKRKQKRPPIQTKASDFTNMFIWGYNAQKSISDIVTPVLLKSFAKPNVRSLTEEEFSELETVKFNIFSNLEPFEDISEARISEVLDIKTANINVVSATKLLLGMYKSQAKKEPTVDEMRQIQSSGFALAYEPDTGSSELDSTNIVTNTETEMELPKV